MLNIDMVRLKYDINGNCNITIENVRERKKKYTFNNMTRANLFLGFVVYPFVNIDLTILNNKTTDQEEYFFNKNNKSNLCDTENFYDLGKLELMRQQRKQMLKNVMQNIRK